MKKEDTTVEQRNEKGGESQMDKARDNESERAGMRDTEEERDARSADEPN